eukprot:gnl/TRDRNA2_/TRDRNA2_179141_c0_seq1.p1 gnl/TRDRNA2_/TRDRNA2_179141_c0~~gnl/TRDRNA2_/TRDRNA2_179141_c0_seq1.p1  ORF type:complete len:452 (+),score=91.85 gnl/TRDRNA2_/TRDRNA2_179141_c0_seq1:68-1423(+)
MSPLGRASFSLALIAMANAMGPDRNSRWVRAAVDSTGGAQVEMPASCESTMAFQKLTDIDHQAVCYDGSPAGYWFKQGENKDLFVIWLMGGNDCESEEECAERFQRTPELMSTNHLPATQSFGGLFDECYSVLGKATIAYSQYCTADLYMGDNPNPGFTGAGKGAQFMGQRHVVAMIQSMAQQGLGQAPGQTLVFGGWSAGSMGAVSWIDFANQMLDRIAPYKVKMWGAFDGILGFGPHMEQRVMKQAELFNAYGMLNQDCAAAHVGEEALCMITHYKLPFVQSKYIMAMPQTDAYACAQEFGSCAFPLTQEQHSWLQEFASKVTEYMKEPAKTSVTECGIHYSYQCLEHGMSMNQGWYRIHPSTSANNPGYSLNDVLAKALSLPQGQCMDPMFDVCTTTDCGCLDQTPAHTHGDVFLADSYGDASMAWWDEFTSGHRSYLREAKLGGNSL